MRRYFIVIILLWCTSLSAEFKISPTSIQIDNLKYRLKGDVKKQTIIKKDESIKKDGKSLKGLKEVRLFDKDNQLKELGIYYMDGSLYQKHKYLYDENKRTITREYYKFDNALEFKHIWVYDKNGNMIFNVIYRPESGFHTNIRYYYDKKNHWLEKEIFQASSQNQKTYYRYNKDGKLIKIIQKTLDDSLMGVILYKYDKNGYKIEEKSKDKYNRIIWQNNYSYDDQNNMIVLKKYDENIPHKKEKYTAVYKNKKKIERRSFIKDQLEEIMRYEYDEKGHVIQAQHYDKAEILKYWTKNKYDDNGNRIEFRSYNSEGTLTQKQEYQYDKMGNILKSKSYSLTDARNQYYNIDYEYKYWE